MVHQLNFIPVSSQLNIIIHKNFLHSPSQPGSSTGSSFSRTTHPNTEYGSIQKSSVQCVVGNYNSGRLLSAVWCSRNCYTSRRDDFIDLPYRAFCDNLSSPELIFKPVALLLEDQRGKASCERYIKASLLFTEQIDITFLNIVGNFGVV